MGSIAKLTARQVSSLKEPGRHSDGGNLYLQITPGGSRSWLFVYKWQGKQREMGLGSYPLISLAGARVAANDARLLLKNPQNPQDPLELKRQNKATVAVPTFGDFAEDQITALESQWRNDKHRAQWRSTLRRYGVSIWNKRIDLITTDDIVLLLTPIWNDKAETASRVRGRIEKMLDAAIARGIRSGANPARWKGHLDHLLGKRHKLKRGHHAAMPYDNVHSFLQELHNREGVSARALEFLILCGSRSGEVIGMTWDELDSSSEVWTIPAHRMKAGKVHRVPLSDAAQSVLARVRPLMGLIEASEGPTKDTRSSYVFPGLRGGKLSPMSLTMQMRRMAVGEYTVHGFRSALRDWAYEISSFSREIAEAALAHSIGDATEKAYRRSDALEKRREFMEAWAKYLTVGFTPG